MAQGTRVHGHNHDNVHIFFLLEGSGAQQIGGRSVDLTPGVARFSCADAAHDIEFASDTSCLVLHFPTDQRRGACRFQSANTATRFIEPLRRHIGEAATAPLAVLDALHARASLEHDDAAAVDWLEHARRLLIGLNEVSIPDIARELSVSREHLSRRFALAFGASPQITLRCARACRAAAALQTGKSAATVADEAGYYDQAHMIRDFRWAFGLTPGQFLQRAAG